jgi:hypothetical protein
VAGLRALVAHAGPPGGGTSRIRRRQLRLVAGVLVVAALLAWAATSAAVTGDPAGAARGVVTVTSARDAAVTGPALAALIVTAIAGITSPSPSALAALARLPTHDAVTAFRAMTMGGGGMAGAALALTLWAAAGLAGTAWAIDRQRTVSPRALRQLISDGGPARTSCSPTATRA